MIFRAIDSSNDWTFGKGLSNYATNEGAINMNVQTRLLSWLGDCFFALDQGVDWKSRLDVGQQDNLELELRGIILNSYGVVGINDLQVSFNRQTRNINLTYNLKTFYSSAFQNQIAVGA